MATKEKAWYESKTKVGAILIGIGAVLGTVGTIVTGDVSAMAGIQAVIIEIGAVLGALGIRDIPFLNK